MKKILSVFALVFVVFSLFNVKTKAFEITEYSSIDPYDGVLEQGGIYAVEVYFQDCGDGVFINKIVNV